MTFEPDDPKDGFPFYVANFESLILYKCIRVTVPMYYLKYKDG